MRPLGRTRSKVTLSVTPRFNPPEPGGDPAHIRRLPTPRPNGRSVLTVHRLRSIGRTRAPTPRLEAELDEERPIREVTDALTRIKGRIISIQREAAAYGVKANVLKTNTDLPAAWKDYSVPWKPAVCRGLIREILIHPRPGPSTFSTRTGSRSSGSDQFAVFRHGATGSARVSRISSHQVTAALTVSRA